MAALPRLSQAVLISVHRVRLVERGSPHSLSLMESGKVRFLFVLFYLLNKNVDVVSHFCLVVPEQILPGVRMIIANPETKGPMGESHLGEVCFMLFEDI